jgi:hypothetical protein
MVLFLIAGGGFGFAIGCPHYYVYKQGMKGEAALLRASHEKQILIEQAQSEVEAAHLRVQAIEAVGKAAQQFPEYRTQEFIGAFANALEACDVKMIYVPTEAGLPIVEAGRTVMSAGE